MIALRRVGWIGLLGLSCLPVWALPVVILDSGKTEPVAKYLPQSRGKLSDQANGPPSLSQLQAKALPVSTPSMTPGNVATLAKHFPYVQQPIFLVGDDELSRTWLHKKRAQLKAIGAVGLLIQAQDMQAVQRMTALADGLPLTPASAEGFARDLGLRHYPVLISREGWEQ